MKIKILIPTYNDWQSLFKLLDEINTLFISQEFQISVVIVNDASNHDKIEEEKLFKTSTEIKKLLEGLNKSENTENESKTQ